MSEQTGADYGSLEFTTRRFQLLALADWALPAVPSGATLTVNTCFKVTVEPDRLCVAAAGQYMSVFAETPAVSVQAGGEIFVPAKKLRAMLSEAPDGDVTVTVKGNQATVTAGKASWHLKLPNPDGYTGLPDLSEATFFPASREKLLSALSVVRHAVGKNAGRPAFTQVSIAEHDGTMYATAVDSSQVSRAPVPGFPLWLSVPAAALDDLVKLLAKNPADSIEVAEAGSYVVFRAAPVTLAALKVTAPFPDVYAQYLRPAEANDLRLRVDKDDLTKALRRMRITADTSNSAVALIADSGGKSPTLTVASRDKEGNSAEETIPADWDGDHQLLVVNAAFLSDMLAAHPSATCEFHIGRERGQARPPLLLEDTEARVTGICPQMPPKLVGY